jgi:tripeptidyl-peptidase I
MLRLLFVTIVLASALAAVSALPMRRKAMEPGVYKGWAPEGWTLLGRTDPNHLITLNIAIKQSNTAQLEALLTRVSDPAHSEYGKHISGSQVHTLIAPTTESISTVVRWLHEHDVADSAMSFSKSKDWVHVTVPIAIAEQLVGEKYYSFMNAETQMTVSRVQGDYTLPEHVAAAVDFIRPTVSFPAVLRKRIKVTKPDDLFVTPTYLRELYNVDEVGQKGTGNIQSFASFLEQYFSYNDLAEFQKLFVNYVR